MGSSNSRANAPSTALQYFHPGPAKALAVSVPPWLKISHRRLAALLTALLAGFLPAFRASGLPPAESMRPARPQLRPLTKLTRLLGGPLPVRLAARDWLGRPVRSTSTAAGIAAAVVLVLVTGGLLDSMAETMAAVFGDARRYDLRIDLAAPRRLDDLRARLDQVPGIERVEGLVEAPASLQSGSHVTSPLLQGLPSGSILVRSLDLDGRTVEPAPDGIVLTRSLASELGVRPGDPVRVRLPPLVGEALLRVTGFADAALGKVATVRLPDLQPHFAMESLITSVAVATRKGEAAAVTRAVAALPEAAHVEDAASLRDELRGGMAFGWIFLAAMLGFSVVLAAAILFNTATLGILERSRELATLQALGRTGREIGAALTLEHGILAMLGLALGLPLRGWISITWSICSES